jgi:uncharacterized protein (TIGR00251 family)
MSTRLQLRVAPGAARNAVVGRYGAGWKIRVAAAPEDGKANDAVVRLLAGALEVPAGDVEIVSGYASRDKIVALAGLEREEIDRRLAKATGAGKDTP